MRIGQILRLPDLRQNVAEELLRRIGQRRRWDVKKAIKNDLQVTSSPEDGVEPLWRMHQALAEKGVAVKPLSFFELVESLFTWGDDYRVYYARLDGEIVAGLLAFYSGRTVEYFTPAFEDQHVSLQGPALLIYRAMVDAVEAGYRLWNFGGTATTAQGVYRYKRLWGAEDFNYYYYVNSYRDIGHIREMPRDQILKEYPFFYVLPFSRLLGEQAGRDGREGRGEWGHE